MPFSRDVELVELCAARSPWAGERELRDQPQRPEKQREGAVGARVTAEILPKEEVGVATHFHDLS